MRIDAEPIDISEPLWQWQGKGSWHFITVPKQVAATYFDLLPRAGWGSIKVSVTIGASTWETSLFREKEGTYLLPVKAAVRKAENLQEKQVITVSITPLVSQ